MLGPEHIPRDPTSGLIEARWGLLLGEPLNHGVAGAHFVEGQSDEMEPRVLTRMVAIFGGSAVALARRVEGGGVETFPPLAEVEELVLGTLQGRAEHPLWDAVVDAIHSARHARAEEEERLREEAAQAEREQERARLAAERERREAEERAQAAVAAAKAEEARLAAERARAEAVAAPAEPIDAIEAAPAPAPQADDAPSTDDADSKTSKKRKR